MSDRKSEPTRPRTHRRQQPSAARTARSTADLTQAQRDFFGAHGFERIDRPGVVAHGRIGGEPVGVREQDRTLYHAGAVFASNYLVTLQRAAVRLGVPAEGLVPLMTRTIENGFELTGPIARGDWATVEAHRDAIAKAQPELEPVYAALAEATVALA